MITKFRVTVLIVLNLALLPYSQATARELPQNPGHLGFRFVPQRASDGSSWLLVQFVRPGGPAEKAGLHAGDLIVASNGKVIRFQDRLDIVLALAELNAEKPGRLTIRRAAKLLPIEILPARMSTAQYEEWRENLTRYFADRELRQKSVHHSHRNQ